MIIWQECIARGHDIESICNDLFIPSMKLPDRPDLADIRNLETVCKIQNWNPVLLVSIQVARRVQRNFPCLAAGIELDDRALRHSAWSAEISPERLLNHSGFYLQWGRIGSSMKMIEDVLGDHIFLRPDSSLKPFTGFDCKLQDLPFEISAHSQTDHVAPGELVFLCKAQEMPEDEYRVWLIDGNIVSHSSYSWDKDRPHVPAPDEVLDSAADLAQIMEPTMTAFTADFAVMEDGVKIVELNGISTSGWYGATNPSCLIDNMRESFWPESFSR